jgi:hypothetical protein
MYVILLYQAKISLDKTALYTSPITLKFYKRRIIMISLSDIFEIQLEKLKNQLNCPEVIIEILRSKREQVLTIAENINLSKNVIKFLPVIPVRYMHINTLMRMLSYDDNWLLRITRLGASWIDIKNINDIIETPDIPYYIIDIKSGKATIDEVFVKDKELAIGQNRSYLTIAESIALCAHYNILSKHHFIRVAGSRFKDEDKDICIKTVK